MSYKSTIKRRIKVIKTINQWAEKVRTTSESKDIFIIEGNAYWVGYFQIIPGLVIHPFKSSGIMVGWK